MSKKSVPQGEVIVRLHKALEACSISIANLAVVKNAVPGYGISMKNHKSVEKVFKALTRQSNVLMRISRNWMR